MNTFDVYFKSISLESSLKELGNISGINLINKGSNNAPPGSMNTARAGMLLQISNNCSLPFSFSSSESL
jgi:hypothetical protein